MIAKIKSKQLSNIKGLPARSIKFIHSLLTIIFPSGSNLKRTDNIYVETLGLAGLFLFLTNINLSWELHRNGETMLIIAFFLTWRYWGALLRQPLFWLMLAFIASIIVSTIIGIENFPEVRHQSEAKKMIRFALFVPLAWWIGTNNDSIRNAFVLVCLGFVLSSLPWFLSWDTLAPLLEGARARTNILGMKTLHYANWAGFLLIGVIILGRDLFPDYFITGKTAIIGYAVFFLTIICLVLGVILPQGRAVWIAVALTIPPGLILRYCIFDRDSSFSIKKMALPILMFCLITAIAGSQYSNIKERILRESLVFTDLMKGQMREAEKKSVGKRIEIYFWAFETESFITIFGWGPRTVQAISRNSDLSEQYNWNLNLEHLHSEYLALLFRTGVFGFSVVALIMFFLIKQLHLGHKNNTISSGYYVFFIVTIAYLLLLGFTNILLRINVFLPFIAGIMFASILRSHKAKKTVRGTHRLTSAL